MTDDCLACTIEEVVNELSEIDGSLEILNRNHDSGIKALVQELRAIRWVLENLVSEVGRRG